MHLNRTHFFFQIIGTVCSVIQVAALIWSWSYKGKELIPPIGPKSVVQESVGLIIVFGWGILMALGTGFVMATLIKKGHPYLLILAFPALIYVVVSFIIIQVFFLGPANEVFTTLKGVDTSTTWGQQQVTQAKYSYFLWVTILTSLHLAALIYSTWCYIRPIGQGNKKIWVAVLFLLLASVYVGNTCHTAVMRAPLASNPYDDSIIPIPKY